MRPSIAALAIGALGSISSIAACSEEPERPAAAASTIATPASVAETGPPASTTPDSTAPDSTAPDSTAPAVTTAAPAAADDTAAPVDTARPIVSFADAASIDGWTNVDDTVMGGVSASATSWESGQLVFAGDLSLENNGGFASVRGPADPAIGAAIGDATALAVDAVGDGRTYVLQLRAADESLYIARFTTSDGEAQQYVLPLDGFEPVTRFLEPAPSTPPLDATTVVQLAVYVLDAQEGAFRLAITGITGITGIAAP